MIAADGECGSCWGKVDGEEERFRVERQNGTTLRDDDNSEWAIDRQTVIEKGPASHVWKRKRMRVRCEV
jgi:hypothetical protein